MSPATAAEATLLAGDEGHRDRWQVHNGVNVEGEVADRLTVNQLLDACRTRIDRLDPAATRAAAEAGALVIDTRCAEQRQQTGIIPGSVHVPLSVLYWRLDPASGYEDPRLADLDRQVILVCADGYSSSVAAATLRDLGFVRACDLNGGFSAWQAADLPVESPRA